MLKLTKKFQVRPAKLSDVAAIVELRNASSQNTRGTDVTAVHWQKRHWYNETIDLEKDSVLVLDSGNVVGYVELITESPYVVYEMVGAVHPSYRSQGIGTQLVHWVENHVQKNIHKAPAKAAVFIQNSIFDSNQPGRDLLASLGFSVARDFVYLQIQMEKKPPDPIWPDGIEVRPLQSGDWEKLDPVMSEAFNDHWGNVEYEPEEQEDAEENDKPFPEESDPEAFDDAYFNSPGLCFVAWDGDEVVGSCLCNATTVEYPGSGYVGSLSICPPWRRRGIGQALTRHALQAFYERGTTQVLTDTDGESLTKAYNVYLNAGMHIFRREHVYEKSIRSGRDLVKRRMLNSLEGS